MEYITQIQCLSCIIRRPTLFNILEFPHSKLMGQHTTITTFMSLQFYSKSPFSIIWKKVSLKHFVYELKLQGPPTLAAWTSLKFFFVIIESNRICNHRIPSIQQVSYFFKIKLLVSGLPLLAIPELKHFKLYFNMAQKVMGNYTDQCVLFYYIFLLFAIDTFSYMKSVNQFP